MPDPETATGFLSLFLSHPGFYGIVAETDGRIVGSNFLDERSSIAGLGPITVDPGVQNSTVGRQLMQHALDRVAEQDRPGVRLVQAAYHNRSLCLYAKLGFEAREMLSNMQGPALNVQIPELRRTTPLPKRTLPPAMTCAGASTGTTAAAR